MTESYSSRFFHSDRAAQWVELLQTRLHWPVTIESVDEADFEAALDCFRLGEVYLLKHSASALALQRPGVDGSGVTQSFSLNFVIRGKMVLSHHDRQNVLKAGDIVLADSEKASRLTFERPTHLITVRLPSNLLEAYIPRPAELCNVVITPRHRFSEPIRASLHALLQLASSGMEPELQQRSIAPFLGLLGFCYLANFGERLQSRAPSSRGRMRQIRQYIDEHITDADLTPEIIADKFGLSTRYLRKLFAAEGDSATRYIQRRRLEKSADKLTNLLWKEHSITDICYDSGFKSASHFTHAFKAHFGLTPKEYRKRITCISRRA